MPHKRWMCVLSMMAGVLATLTVMASALAAPAPPPEGQEAAPSGSEAVAPAATAGASSAPAGGYPCTGDGVYLCADSQPGGDSLQHLGNALDGAGGLSSASPDRDASIWTTGSPPPVGQAAVRESAAALAPYCTQLVRNGGFETGTFMYWDTSGSPSGSPSVVTTGGHSGNASALLGGRNHAVDRVSQVVSCPFYGSNTFESWIYIHTEETPGTAYDCLLIRMDGPGWGTSSNHCASGGELDHWWMHLTGTGAWGTCPPGSTVRVSFSATTDYSRLT